MADDPNARAREAASAQLGALLVDRDVSGAHTVEGGALEVMRRGRRERLDVVIDDELWQALRDLGADDGPVVIDLMPHRLRAAPVAGGKLMLHLEKAPPSDPRLAALVEERLLPEAAAEAVLRTALAGNGLVVVGTARAAARRLAIATARELAEHAPVMSLGDVAADWLLPAPTLDDIAARARCAVDLGAEALLASSLAIDDAITLARARLPVPVFAAVHVGNVAALHAAFALAGDDLSVDAVAGQVCVVGRALNGRAVLLEQHAPVIGGGVTGEALASPPARDPTPRAPEPVTREPEVVTAGSPMALPPGTPSLAEPAPDMPPLAPLPSGPPAEWASSSPTRDPGWELGPRGDFAGDDEDTPVGAFDAVLAGVKKRPAFQPRPPPEHPQTRQLQGEAGTPGADGAPPDPLGGLTLEPPPGGVPADDDAGDADDGGDTP